MSEPRQRAHPLILASASPRRASLLRQIGIPFEVVPSDVSEDVTLSPEPKEHALELARRKARDVAGRRADGIILGADTVVVLDGEILGKPHGADEAVQMLRKLSGRWHEVITAVVLLDPSKGGSHEAVEVTRVKFRDLSGEEVEEYVASGESMDKAGAYGIQGMGAVLVERIEGCYFNVVGLPLARLVEMLRGNEGE